jgi:hypothetical protein
MVSLRADCRCCMCALAAFPAVRKCLPVRPRPRRAFNMLEDRSWTTRWLRFHFTEEFLVFSPEIVYASPRGDADLLLSTMLQGGQSADLVATSTIIREMNPQAAPMADGIFFQRVVKRAKSVRTVRH